MRFDASPVYDEVMSESTRRTTLTLPASALERAGEIALERHVTVSAVVAEVLEEGLASRARSRRAGDVLAAYKAAFAGFSEEERLLLDGVDLEPEPEGA